MSSLIHDKNCTIRLGVCICSPKKIINSDYKINSVKVDELNGKLDDYFMIQVDDNKVQIRKYI